MSPVFVAWHDQHLLRRLDHACRNHYGVEQHLAAGAAPRRGLSAGDGRIVFDTVAAVAVLVILPNTGTQRLRTLALLPVVIGAQIVCGYAWAGGGWLL